MSFGATLAAAAAARARRKEQEARRAMAEAMADHRALNEMQSLYRDWTRPPQFVKRGGQWYAVIEYGPSVPCVPRRPRA